MHLGSVCPISERTDDRLPLNKPYLDSSRKLILTRDGTTPEGSDCSRISGLGGGALALRAMMKSRTRGANR